MPPFFDTNVLVYFVDEDEPEKRQVARALVEQHLFAGDGVLSVQVLREFYSSTRRLRCPLSDEKAKEGVRYLASFSPIKADCRVARGGDPIADGRKVQPALRDRGIRHVTKKVTREPGGAYA